MNFNEVFKKDFPDDNIKSHQKSGLDHLSIKHKLRKTTKGETENVQIDSPSLFRVNVENKERSAEKKTGTKLKAFRFQ